MCIFWENFFLVGLNNLKANRHIFRLDVRCVRLGWRHTKVNITLVSRARCRARVWWNVETIIIWRHRISNTSAALLSILSNLFTSLLFLMFACVTAHTWHYMHCTSPDACCYVLNFACITAYTWYYMFCTFAYITSIPGTTCAALHLHNRAYLALHVLHFVYVTGHTWHYMCCTLST